MIRPCAVGVIATALLAACGGGTSSTPAQMLTAETGAGSTTASENPLPAKLVGAWRLESGPTTDLVHLYLRPSAYTVSRGGGSHTGQVEADGSILRFTALCGDSSVEGVGRYRWTLDRNALHLVLLGRDECSGRSAVLEDAIYTR